MNKIRYFDYNATTPCDSHVFASMIPFFSEKYYNPSSFYMSSGDVRNSIEISRKQVASLLSAKPNEITFTSGGTEADNLAILGTAHRYIDRGKHLITSSIEHPAVLHTFQKLEKEGFSVSYLPVDSVGLINPDDLKKVINKNTILVSIMHANNEIGTIQPIKELSQISHQAGALFHTDAVQTCGKIDVNINDLEVDLLSLSSHKIYGPKGSGALFIKSGVKIEPIIYGGGHERGMRSGTENVPGIIGFGKACELISEQYQAEATRIRFLRDQLQETILSKIPEVLVNGNTKNRLFNTLNISIKFIEGEAMIAFLDQEGICLSSGSACSSKSLDPSHVLLAIGLSHEDAHGSLRFSLGKFNTEDDIIFLLSVLPKVVDRLRKMSPFWKK